MSLFGELFGQEEKVKRRKVTKGDQANILKKQGDKCAECGKKLYASSVFQWDHKKALALGGSDTLRNVQVLCPNCHAEKTREDRAKIAKKNRRKAEESGGSILDWNIDITVPEDGSIWDATIGLSKDTKKKRGKRKKK